MASGTSSTKPVPTWLVQDASESSANAVVTGARWGWSFKCSLVVALISAFAHFTGYVGAGVLVG
jgi:hypothetical protein